MLIRNKLILRFTLLVLAIQLCFSAFIYYFHAATREQRFSQRLAGKGTMTARLLLRQPQSNEEALRTFRRRDLLTILDEQISIYDPDGHLIYTSDDSLSQRQNSYYLPQVEVGKPVQFTDGELEVVGLTHEYRGRQYRIFAAGRDQFGLLQLDKLRLILLVGNAGALVLIILAGWYFADESLKPMERVVKQVERITAGRLSLRVDEGNGTDEIAQLAVTFNQMLTRVEQAFEMQKNFLSHASHELRTPLATALGTLETSFAYDTDLAEAKASTASAVEELKHLIGLTNALLALAKAEDASFRRDIVRLDDCLTQALSYCQRKYPHHHVQLTFGELPATDDDPFRVLGNEQLLTTALLNLLDNACKYSSQVVHVCLGYQGPKLVVTVQDTGIGIAPTELPRVTNALYRAENARHAPGYGLGLTVTQKIAERHGGSLTLVSAPGQGTTATLVLPGA
ncbi:ATP-binding protein [Hymenobacter sp. YC55]|uniref:sensor histidine kinase n=1 Tax=Hymenobacter sp. YC55 TaxID=3034019 RepID=UPI0023F8560C|nr:ATP-binding protein [Hymenobacter sp. YC55]MDF7814777.1 ATP-binding protein [Hymenobacter sp. YC55]